MINGHLEHELMILAFSIDILSAGKPSLHQAAFFDSVVKIFKGVIPSVIGICLLMISGNQIFYHKLALNSMVNAPIYDTNEDASKASPIIVLV
jgi:hypothetical protein